MNSAAVIEELPGLQLAQPNDVRGLNTEERDRLIVFTRRRAKQAVVESLYGDMVWWPAGATNNQNRSSSKLDFSTVPANFIPQMKAMTYRYIRRGAGLQQRPGAATIKKFFTSARAFMKYLDKMGISSLEQVTPLVCSSYLQESVRAKGPASQGKPAAEFPSTTKTPSPYKRRRAVEYVYELSQFTDTPAPFHPWPKGKNSDQSARSVRDISAKTPLMPDDVFEKLFQAAWRDVQAAEFALDLRDELEEVPKQLAGLNPKYITQLKNRVLAERGFQGSCRTLNIFLSKLRISCYVVIASLSGCRIHEITNLKSDCLFSTKDADGNVYFWIKSVSSKTGAGSTEWMVPEAAASAIRVLKRLALPDQRTLLAEMDSLNGMPPQDKRISDPAAHVGALFLGRDLANHGRVRTWTVLAVNEALRKFAAGEGITWHLTSHQFRRKFANYAARSQFGDLRYLKEHFKHWSTDMTLGYALNDSQEMALYLEIQDELDEIKRGVVETWLRVDEPLAGGYGKGLVEWRSQSETIVLFKNRSAMVHAIAASTPIRSNGHSWCTAGDTLCVGNTTERTRCADDCESGVIGRKHAELYQGLYDQLEELSAVNDIGPGGEARVRRDLERCRKTLNILSTQPIEASVA